MKSSELMSNPLSVIVMILLGLIIILSIFRSVSPSLTLGIGFNAHIGDLRGSFELETFDNNSTDNQPVFAMYYAEWCGHCKRAKPEFNKLMKDYKGNVKLLLIDAEAKEHADLVKEQKISGFPTIRMYPKGLSQNYNDYSGERTYTNFVEYLGSIEGNMDRAPDNAAPVYPK